MIVPIQNSDVADLLEIEGENRFRIRAYRDATWTVGGHSRSVAEMVEQDEEEFASFLRERGVDVRS